MALNQEALTNLISADLTARNENWSAIDNVFDGTTPKPLAVSSGTVASSTISASNLNASTIKDYGETAVITADVTGATTIDLEDGNVIQHTLSGDPTYTFSNPPASGTAGSFTLIIIQPATAVSVTWPASVAWRDGAEPALDTDSATYILTFITVDGGATWYGAEVGEF